MCPFESKTHSFIVKMWLEETIIGSGRGKWRGHITHVPDGERHYLESTDGIPAFIGRYLEGTGVKANKIGRLRRWLSSKKEQLDQERESRD